MMKASSLLYAVAFVSAPTFAGPLTIPDNMSDDLFRSTAVSAAARSGSADSYRPSFTTTDTRRFTMAGRFPLGNDFRHAKVPLGSDWSLGWTNDQYGRSVGFSHPLPLGKDGVIRFGVIRENIPNVPNHNAAGMSVTFTW